MRLHTGSLLRRTSEAYGRWRGRRYLREPAEPLRQSGDQFRLLVHSLNHCAIYMLDPQGRVLTWNAGAEKIKGYRAAEIIGRSSDIFYSPEDIQSGRPARNRRLALENGFVEDQAWRVRKDGTRFWADSLIVPVRDFRGEHVGFAAVTRDLTERKRREEELESAVAQRTADLKKAVLELRSFSYMLSHDLRAPLRALEGLSHFLMERLQERVDAESRAMLERMSEAACRLDRMIQDLLAYTGLAGRPGGMAPVDLDRVLTYVRGLYPALQGARIEVRRPLGRVLGQESLLTLAVSHLLDNAVKFVPRERVPEVRVWSERGGGRLRLLIQDNGPGIPQDLRERIFEPFQRLESGSLREGTGIGLAIVRKSVAQMGGATRVESCEKGSLFAIELPEA